jgi:CheY-like chemotaxis protein
VIDTGSGIAADQFESIFNPFERAEHGMQKRRGTGLGLPLSRRYARALGGDVTLVHSHLGTGSTFRFTFNVQHSNKAGLGENAEKVLPVKHLAVGQPARRILAVDDDSENLQMLRFMLGEIGFVVEAAGNGADALKRCGEGPRFDLILIDRRMPGMDGIETIKRLRELPGGRNIPVIMVTANELADGVQEPVDGYILKPLRREFLLMEIQRVTGVQYEYDEESIVSQKQNIAVDPDDLLQVPAAQRELFRNAVQSGNIRQMQDITANIANDHPGLAAGLSELISRYDYDELTQLLKQNQGAS